LTKHGVVLLNLREGTAKCQWGEIPNAPRSVLFRQWSALARQWKCKAKRSNNEMSERGDIDEISALECDKGTHNTIAFMESSSNNDGDAFACLSLSVHYSFTHSLIHSPLQCPSNWNGLVDVASFKQQQCLFAGGTIQNELGNGHEI
jgi:hypothetical protein